MGQHQGWGGSPQRQDSATSGLERRNPKNGTSQCLGWCGATQKTKSRDIRTGAAQPQKRNLAMSGMERCNPKKRNRATSELERRNVGYEAT
jgi:hypothetical protein